MCALPSTDAPSVVEAIRKFLSFGQEHEFGRQLSWSIVIVNAEISLEDWVERLRMMLDKMQCFESISTTSSLTEEHELTIYFIFGISKVRKSQYPFPLYFVYMQTERIDSNHFAQQNSVQALYRALEIWDYSVLNIVQGIGRFLVDKWHYVTFPTNEVTFPTNEVTFPTNEVTLKLREIDVLFVGTACDRRLDFLNTLYQEVQKEKHDVKFDVRWCGVSHAQLNDLQSNSKIVINYHYEKSTILQQPLETARVIPALENGCFVLSEPSYEHDVEECLAKLPVNLRHRFITCANMAEFVFSTLKIITR